MVYTTGLINNTKDGGTSAANVIVNITNDDPVNTALVLVKVFYTTGTGVAKTPLHFTGYYVVSGFVDIHTFSIAGVIAYEVQIEIDSSTPNLTIPTCFASDTFGNPIGDKRVLQPEFAIIPALS
ncbi:hypothetical protein GCM10008018_59400 [Paenibacillus marchantiophytorum]|uniref:CARDB domain-containing protein n=1 Tax=Paenibacillus marchantiophytorum TaxID=1619310 RepID=A0ABQ1FB37_9BACL|nr:hypothetical protein [Paenibacillus marchantiophytorum]GGA05518.1 hypothetical protein GCM10008018_59400 [Paenibacillus marchantiophytorum]